MILFADFNIKICAHSTVQQYSLMKMFDLVPLSLLKSKMTYNLSRHFHQEIPAQGNSVVPRSTSNLGLCNNYLEGGGGGGGGGRGGGREIKRGHRGKLQLQKGG